MSFIDHIHSALGVIREIDRPSRVAVCDASTQVDADLLPEPTKVVPEIDGDQRQSANGISPGPKITRPVIDALWVE